MAGNMKPRQTVAVAPVNWNAIQMLGTTVEPKKMVNIRTPVMRVNRTVSWASGGAFEKRIESTLRRSEKFKRGNTNMICSA